MRIIEGKKFCKGGMDTAIQVTSKNNYNGQGNITIML